MSLPMAFEMSRDLLLEFSESRKNLSTPPVVTFEEAVGVLKDGLLLKEGVCGGVLWALHRVGSVVVVEWETLGEDEGGGGEEVVRNRLVVLEPRWLTNVLATVVTMRFGKNI